MKHNIIAKLLHPQYKNKGMADLGPLSIYMDTWTK